MAPDTTGSRSPPLGNDCPPITPSHSSTPKHLCLRTFALPIYSHKYCSFPHILKVSALVSPYLKGFPAAPALKQGLPDALTLPPSFSFSTLPTGHPTVFLLPGSRPTECQLREDCIARAWNVLDVYFLNFITQKMYYEREQHGVLLLSTLATSGMSLGLRLPY